MGGAQKGGLCHGYLFDLGNVDDQWARQATFVYVEDAFVGYDVCGVDGAFNGDQGCHGKACADDGPYACVLPKASKGTDGMQRYGGDVLQGYAAMECSVHIVLKLQSPCQLKSCLAAKLIIIIHSPKRCVKLLIFVHLL